MTTTDFCRPTIEIHLLSGSANILVLKFCRRLLTLVIQSGLSVILSACLLELIYRELKSSTISTQYEANVCRKQMLKSN